jgi:hypothetical protein
VKLIPEVKTVERYAADVIFSAPRVSADEFERVTGWRIDPEGLCNGDRCVPFRGDAADAVVLDAAARALGMPLVHDEAHGLWALGAEAGGRAIRTAVAPELELPDLDGRSFRLSSLRGTKVLLVAWASW